MGYKQYCKDYQDIENYEKALADNFKGWDCHHRLETHTPDGKRREVDIGYKELKALGLYYNRPAEELIFLPRSEHNVFNKGKPGYWKGKQGYWKGKTGPNYGKHHSVETRKKISEGNKGTRWFNNGEINIRAKECPEGFVPGRLR